MSKREINDKNIQSACDLVVERAAEMMVEEIGAPIEMMIDRMMTYAGAQMCVLDGNRKTAAILRKLADNVEGGIFDAVTGEAARGRARH
ncbi:hypothetical protein GOC60_10200 [Sinorhizobium meliloti]|nr:hypothetical protein [Sinorhizobium meliloti]MDX0348916.1 hypothetical protein [Sinorhizobium meliloti]